MKKLENTKVMFFTGLIAVFVSGCGSMKTLMLSDSRIERDLERIDTRCTYIPRVYSGIAYDFCRLHAEPKTLASGPDVFVFAGLDLMLSGVIDTVALPYTIYLQSDLGSNHL